MYIHIAVMLFGLSSVIGKGMSVPAYAIAWGRSLFSAGLLFAFMKAKRIEPGIKKADISLMFLGGALLAVHWTAFFFSVKQASVAVGTITFSAFPLFVVFLEPLVFKEKMSKTNLVSAAAILFGVFLTLRMGEGGGHYIEGFAYGMASSLTYALLSLVNRRLSAHYPGVKVCFYQQLTVVLLLLFAAAPTVKVWQPGDYISMAAIGAVCTAFAFSLFVEGQKYIKASTAGVVSGMETVYSVLFAMLFLKELPAPGQLSGGAVILLSAGINSLRNEH